jgi:hypothetical protein
MECYPTVVGSQVTVVIVIVESMTYVIEDFYMIEMSGDRLCLAVEHFGSDDLEALDMYDRLELSWLYGWPLLVVKEVVRYDL